ncbi:HET-domain-containing protein [Periconia macrospinosa]|uniref:HET-domain-containing protein n=1 Tax=Periconia macrospinosa TaxID=97972 RepID=A0A2V1ECF3_9PLEO|nr:HET-domain-containing protein [Periconia macrospinosa]
MQLCDFCVEHILESSKSWDYHKCYTCLKEDSEWSTLVESSPGKVRFEGDVTKNVNEKKEAKSRCLFCWTLSQDVHNVAPELEEHHKPIYRWSMRSLSTIRESLETVVIAFKQVPLIKKEGNIELEQVTLPERTFYLFPEKDLSPLPSIEKLGPSTDPAINGGSQIKTWVETCNETHTGCMKRKKANSASAQAIPTRLLHIAGPPKSAFKVIETATTPVRGPYASLSHCWGGDTFVELRQKTKKQFMTDGVPWQMMTKNFQDAIEIARFIGVEYIWIDSLCIIQGPDGDFSSEASKMHQVYRNSYCNIALVDSPNSKGGAFRSRNPNYVAPVRYVPKEESAIFGHKPWGVIAGDLWDRELLKTFLYVRGWVFQERMLSPRILHFAKNQVFWDCPSLSACETLPSGLPQPMDKTARSERHWRGRLQEPEERTAPLVGPNDEPPYDFWREAVQKYTTCNLTKGRDKLIAMWGIAKLMRDEFKCEYGHGLWERNLEDQLAWRVAECQLLERPSESKEEHISRNIPSWSWASMDGRIDVPDQLTDAPHYMVKDHFGAPLMFDLVGVRRAAASRKSQLGESQPPAQIRVMSDSVVELQHRYKDLERARKETNDHAHQDVIDRDAEPKFYHSSIAIQGHVCPGTLEQDSVSGSWFLRVDGLTDTVIAAFPDLVPRKHDLSRFYVVLSAKLFKPDHSRPGSVYGRGILMKDAGKNHFHRTGAFSFRNLSLQEFAKLLMIDSQTPLSDMLKTNAGRKFWLD